jgi:hypothetical protein
MCNFENGFILCTCKDKEKPIVHNQNSRRYKREQATIPKVYQWHVFKFEEYRNDDEPIMEGLYELPVEDIGKGLTEEWVLLNLNVRNCFDVAYTPQEGDNLVIQDSQQPWVYLSFIFQNGGWGKGHYSSFDALQTLMIQGEVGSDPT